MRKVKTCDFGRYLKIGDKIVFKKRHALKKCTYGMKGEVLGIYPYFILLKVKQHRVCISRIPTVYESILKIEEAGI